MRKECGGDGNERASAPNGWKHVQGKKEKVSGEKEMRGRSGGWARVGERGLSAVQTEQKR